MAERKFHSNINLSAGGTFGPSCPDGVDIAYVQTGKYFKIKPVLHKLLSSGFPSFVDRTCRL